MPISKRRRFLITSLVLSLGFIAVQFLVSVNRFWAIGILGALTALLFVWSLFEGLGKNMTLVTLILPTMFTLGVGFFWFLLPGSVFTRIPILVFYGVGIYILCLTMNIFSVSAATKTIALMRAARGVGFVLTLVTSFLVFDSILSLRAAIWITAPFVALASVPLFFQGLWVAGLETEFRKDLLFLTLAFSLVVGEISVSLYFWPVTVVTGSLFLTVAVYILMGLGQAKIEDRLFLATIREHLSVGVLVFIAVFFATHWGG
jgi:hypothetical protein